MRRFVLHQYEPNPSKFDGFRVFFFIFCSQVQKKWYKNETFCIFSRRPSPQAPQDPVSGQELISLVSWDKFSSRLDQMAPHSCPFLVSNFEVFQKPRSRPPLPSKNHHGKNGKHHFTPVFVLNQLDPILPMEPFDDIGWEQGQKAGRQIYETCRKNFVRSPRKSMNIC